MLNKPIGRMIVVAALALSGAVMFQTQVQAKPAPSRASSGNQSTVFRCVRSGRSFATIAQRGSRRSAPLITWQRYVGEMTPQERCDLVSKKLTNAVRQNGGSLSRLMLTTGNLNNQPVICYITPRSPRCSNTNMLFTITNPESARDPGRVLASLLLFGTPGSIGSVPESVPDGEEQEEAAVDMEEVVEQAFSSPESADGDEESESSPEAAESGDDNEELGGNASEATDSESDGGGGSPW